MTFIILIVALLLMTSKKMHPNRILKILIFAPLSISAANDSLPSRTALFDALRVYHLENAEAQTMKYKIAEKFNWMNWTPTVGIGYNLQGQPRPTISYSLGQVKANINQKAQNEAEKSQILRGSILAFKTDSINLEMAIRKVEILKRSLRAEEQKAEVEDRIWENTKARYKEYKITEAEYLTALKYQTERAAIYGRQLAEIEIEELTVLKLARF